MRSGWNAFVKEDLSAAPTGSGALQGLVFAVKDVFAVAGHVNSAGNPKWLETHRPAGKHAVAVSRLLAAGACLSGAAHTDELMFSLNGENFHYGTPVNPKAPGCIPGGSSSGSAVAVAAGLADFALGTDTGGSVRIPSSYCGLYGMRPTHGMIPLDGVIPLAKSFDTIGWMARDAQMLHKVGLTLIENAVSASGGRFRRLNLPSDAWQLADPHSQRALMPYCRMLSESLEIRQITVARSGLADWMETFRTLQGYEIWSAHGDWIRLHKPVFGPGIAERFAWASTLQKEVYDQNAAVRLSIQTELAELLGDDGLIAIPTAPCPAPRIGLSGEELELTRAKTLRLSCIAGLGGLPQVTIPFTGADELPIGLSFIAGPGQDAKLLNWICETAEVFQPKRAPLQQGK